MIFSNDRTAKGALLNTLSEEQTATWVREEQAAAWARFYAIEVDSSSIERSQPPRDWTLRSPILSRRVEDGQGATGPFELLQDAGGLTPG